jgi:carbon storage regulator
MCHMLVLTRRPGQRIIIDDNIVVSVVSMKNGQVRLGIDAPPSVHIVREELQDTPAKATIPAILKARASFAAAVS